MKNLLLFIIIFSLTNSLGQSKKKQIEQLNYRINSLSTVFGLERDSFNLQINSFKLQIVDLNKSISKLNSSIVNLEAKIEELNKIVQTIDKPKEQIQEVITGKSERTSTKTGKSNKTNGNDASNEASTTVQNSDPFGSGGSGGKNGAGNGPFSGPGNSDDGEQGLGKGNGASRLRVNNAVLPQYDIDYDSNVHLQLTINANGEVVAAKCIKSKTTCSDQRIINQVVNEVIRQVRYKKEIGAGLVYTFYTVKILAK